LETDMPLGLGPVFAYERLTSARRWQTYALRSLIVTALLFAMITIALSYRSFANQTPAQRYAELGESYLYALVGVELALVMLAAPAATASAICLDRARGTLAHVMATDLTDPEIVLGKLAARLLPVFGLVAGTWPVMAISTLLGGIDPVALVLAMAIIVIVAVLGCALALALSVWARKPHEVILTCYTFWLAILMAWPIWFVLSSGRIAIVPGQWLLVINPFYLAFAPYAAPGRVGFWEYACVFAASLTSSAGLIWLAVRRLRPVARRMAGEAVRDSALGPVARLRRWLPGPTLEGNPVFWREWHRTRRSAWMTWLVVLLGGSTGLACIIGAVSVWRNGVIAFNAGGPAQLAGIMGYMLQVVLGLLMLSAVAPLSLSEERQRGSLDVLSAAPVSAWTIVLAKWWATFRIVPLLALGPGVMCFALATARRAALPPPWAVQQPIAIGFRIGGAVLIMATVIAHGAALVSIGLVLATWIKRQSRAIAATICAATLMDVAVPLLMNVCFPGQLGLRLSYLSPISVMSAMADELPMRLDRLPGILWWIGFWDVAVAGLAASLLWLAGRTFDEASGRMREQADKAPARADALVALGMMSGVASLYVAVTVWTVGVYPHRLQYSDEGLATLVIPLLVGFSLLMLSAIAPLPASAEQCERPAPHATSTPNSPRTSILKSWWSTFRPVPFLALGPGLVALALATAPEAPSLPSFLGAPPPPVAVRAGPVVRVLPTQRLPTQDVPLGDRLAAAAGLVTTILAHGAAIASAGLMLGAWFKRKGLAVAASAGTLIAAALISPVLLHFLVIGPIFGDRFFPPMATASSPIGVAGYCTLLLLSREPLRVGYVPLTLFCNVIVAVLAVGLLQLMSRKLVREMPSLRWIDLGPSSPIGSPQYASARPSPSQGAS
jgi:ABC-type transport system involved in multi-copper enzyme maturation permease subunit